MDQMARDFADQAHFLFVYVREAHPDEFPDHPEHHSIEQKYQHARDMRERHKTPRPILVRHPLGPGLRSRPGAGGGVEDTSGGAPDGIYSAPLAVNSG